MNAKENLWIFYDFTRKVLVRDRSMIYSMALRNLKARYIGSSFGFFWAVLNPILLLAIYGLVFGGFMGTKSNHQYGTDSFFLYLTCGLMPWQFFQFTISSSTDIMKANKNLIKKAVGFPSEVLPIINVVTNLINHCIAMGIAFIIIIVFTGGLTLYTPLILIYTFLTIILSIGLGWIISSLGVYLKDMSQIINLLTLMWFFLTPVFWSSERVPEHIMRILKYNPMYVVIDGYRHLLLQGSMPSIGALVYLTALSFITFAVGGVFFRKLKPGFADII